jgi:hypothetical protein
VVCKGCTSDFHKVGGLLIEAARMKSFFAYALLVIGVPLLAGVAIGGIITVPIARLLHSQTRITLSNSLYLEYLEVVNGLVASVAGAVLFRLFGLTAGVIVPGIMAAWVTFYFFSYHQPKRAWASWLAGILIGWFTLARMVLLL